MNALRWIEKKGRPLAEVQLEDRELAWRGFVLNTVLLSLMFFTTVYCLLNLLFWFGGMDEGSAVSTFLGVFILSGIYWVSRRRSVQLAIYIFSGFSILVSFALSFGWGVTDISTNAFYVMAILENGILLRGRAFMLVMSVLVLGYLFLGLSQLYGVFTPPFFTLLGANTINVTLIFTFLTVLGHISSRLIDRVLLDQITEARRRQELESRAKIAAEVQLKMLPDRPPECANYDIAGQCLPARDVGGDFYNYHLLLNGDLAVTIGDVTGKGMPAALLMAITTGMIDSLMPAAIEPGQLLATVAARLHKHSHTSGLNTACLVAFFNRDRLRVANAGCISPLIRRAAGHLEWLDVGGLPLGVNQKSEVYRQVEAALYPGDWVIFTTDGVVEAMNASRQIMGFKSLENIIAAAPAHTALAMRRHIIEQVQRYQSGHEQEDDITVVVVHVLENSYVA